MSNRIRHGSARRGITMGALFLLISVTVLSAHDMFLKPDPSTFQVFPWSVSTNPFLNTINCTLD